MSSSVDTSVSDDAIKAAMSGGISSAIPKEAKQQRQKMQREASQRPGVGNKAKSYSVPAGVQAYLDKAEDDDAAGGANDAAVKAALSGGISSAVSREERKAGGGGAGGSSHSRPGMTRAYSVPQGVQAFLDKADDGERGEKSAVVKAAVSGGIAAAVPTGDGQVKKKKTESPSSAPAPKEITPVPAEVREWLGSSLCSEDADAVMRATSTGGTVATELKAKTYAVPAGVRAYLDKAKDEAAEEEMSPAVKAAMSGGIAAAVPKGVEQVQQKAKSSSASATAPKEIAPVPAEVSEWLESSLSSEDAGAVMRATSTGGTVATELKQKTYAVPAGVRAYLDKATGDGDEAAEEETSPAVKAAMSGGITAAMPTGAAQVQQKAKSSSASATAPQEITPVPAEVREWLESSLSPKDADAVMRTTSTGGSLATELKAKTYAAPAGVKAYLEKATDDGHEVDTSPAVKVAVSGGIAAAASMDSQDNSTAASESSDSRGDSTQPAAAPVSSGVQADLDMVEDPEQEGTSDAVVTTTSGGISAAEKSSSPSQYDGEETTGPTIEEELSERLDITKACARELVSSSKGCLGINPSDVDSELSSRPEIIDMGLALRGLRMSGGHFAARAEELQNLPAQ